MSQSLCVTASLRLDKVQCNFYSAAVISLYDDRTSLSRLNRQIHLDFSTANRIVADLWQRIATSPSHHRLCPLIGVNME